MILYLVPGVRFHNSSALLHPVLADYRKRLHPAIDSSTPFVRPSSSLPIHAQSQCCGSIPALSERLLSVLLLRLQCIRSLFSRYLRLDRLRGRTISTRSGDGCVCLFATGECCYPTQVADLPHRADDTAAKVPATDHKLVKWNSSAPHPAHLNLLSATHLSPRSA